MSGVASPFRGPDVWLTQSWHGRFNTTRGHYSLFPTYVPPGPRLRAPPFERADADDVSRYDLDNATSYRPTNDDCLMRSVVQPNFCSVCLEGLWLSLLARVDLIEDLRVTCPGLNTRVVHVDLVQLAQFREHPIDSTESYTITWRRDGRVVEALANRTEVELDDEDGTYRVDVTYAVDQVRLDPEAYLHASRTFDVTPHTCSGG